jgi:hypothetical protein
LAANSGLLGQQSRGLMDLTLRLLAANKIYFNAFNNKQINAMSGLESVPD